MLDTFDKRPLATQSAAGAFNDQLFDFLLEVQAAGWMRALVKELEATKRLPVRFLTAELQKVCVNLKSGALPRGRAAIAIARYAATEHR